MQNHETLSQPNKRKFTYIRLITIICLAAAIIMTFTMLNGPEDELIDNEWLAISDSGFTYNLHFEEQYAVFTSDQLKWEYTFSYNEDSLVLTEQGTEKESYEILFEVIVKERGYELIPKNENAEVSFGNLSLLHM